MDNIQEKMALNFIKKCLRCNHNPINDLEERITRDKFHLESWTKILNETLNIINGSNVELHHQLIEWCNSKNIDYEKYGVASKR